MVLRSSYSLKSVVPGDSPKLVKELLRFLHGDNQDDCAQGWPLCRLPALPLAARRIMLVPDLNPVPYFPSANSAITTAVPYSSRTQSPFFMTAILCSPALARARHTYGNSNLLQTLSLYAEKSLRKSLLEGYLRVPCRLDRPNGRKTTTPIVFAFRQSLEPVCRLLVVKLVFVR
jgi:hypothetical protein